MTGPRQDDDAIAAAWSRLRATMAAARVALDRARTTPVLTKEERDRLHHDALSGALGRDMETLARHVARGETSWSEAFEGTGPYSQLLAGHLTTMSERYGEQLRDALEDDEEFDPNAVSPELEHLEPR